MILCYSKNKNTTVEVLEDGNFYVHTTIMDTLFEGEVDMTVESPNLEILSVKGKINRAFFGEPKDISSELARLVGVRIASGITKVVKNLLANLEGNSYLISMTMDCVEGIPLALTVDPLASVLPRLWKSGDFDPMELVKMNPRLKNSCIAFMEEGDNHVKIQQE